MFFKYFLTWKNFKCLQQEAFREPPLPNLLKNEENQCLIIDVSTISFLSTISLYFGNVMIVFPLIIWVRWWFFFFFFGFFQHFSKMFFICFFMLLKLNSMFNSCARRWHLCKDMRKHQRSLIFLWDWPTTYCLLKKRRSFGHLAPVIHGSSYWFFCITFTFPSSILKDSSIFASSLSSLSWETLRPFLCLLFLRFGRNGIWQHWSEPWIWLCKIHSSAASIQSFCLELLL